MSGGGSAPKPDKNIGIAALRTAEIGEDYLAWMQGQAEVTNEWADEDRARYQEVFQPLQDDFIAEAQAYNSPERRAAFESAAVADVEQQTDIARAVQERDMMAKGIDPRSGRYDASRRRVEMDAALGKAGAATTARRFNEQTGRALRADALNMGSGFAVNPATSIGLSNSGMASGASAAQRGNEQMGSLLNMDYQNRMSAWQTQQQQGAGLWGAVGTVGGAIAGALPWTAMLSSKEAKTNKRKAPGILDSLKDVPVEAWDYKQGRGDGGTHIGAYAEDVHKSLGVGDGKTIPVPDAVGIAWKGIKELNAKVDKIAAKVAA
ncbi:tail fiber domain-containing protein [Salipiger sp.]|uniref:tail fiber domain-containing protein n=1 Tax=Salipiger sp. TaxID=2078585 RepID=UPI003A96E9AB